MEHSRQLRVIQAAVASIMSITGADEETARRYWGRISSDNGAIREALEDSWRRHDEFEIDAESFMWE